MKTMEAKQKQLSEWFQRKALARWRLLATSGVSLEQGALEIGVTAAELRAWSRGAEVEAPLLVPVEAVGETAGRQTLVVVFAAAYESRSSPSRRSPSW